MNHQTARCIVCCWPVCHSTTPVFLKAAVMFARVNEMSEASLIMPGRLCIEIVFPGLLNSQLFLCHFRFEWPHHCYIQWLESACALRWEGIHVSAILSMVKHCVKCAMAHVMVKKYHDGFFFATVSIFLDVFQHF
jgi:hypothetical protein